MEKLKVLYAEDDPLTVMEVAEQLEERGFEVIVATNGTEALKLFRERQPNVVLLDVDMPGHNGFEVLQIIRLTDHYTPIVIYSSLGDEANQMRGLESGAYTYLVKNCAPAVVANISEAIWQVEEETDNPVGALKNLAYRLRKALREDRKSVV